MARPYGEATKLIIAACAERPRTAHELAALTNRTAEATRHTVWCLVQKHLLRSIRLFHKGGDRSRLKYALGAVDLPYRPFERRTGIRAQRSFAPARRMTPAQLEALHTAFHIRRPSNLPGALRTVRASRLLMLHESIQRFAARATVGSTLGGQSYPSGVLSQRREELAA